MLKQGAQGSNVKDLQHKLMKLGYQVTADGVFGPKTEDAVRQLQKATGNDVDGVVGPMTTQAIETRIAQGWNVQQPPRRDDVGQKQQQPQSKK